MNPLIRPPVCWASCSNWFDYKTLRIYSILPPYVSKCSRSGAAHIQPNANRKVTLQSGRLQEVCLVFSYNLITKFHLFRQTS